MSALDRLAAIIAEHDDLVVRRGEDYCRCGEPVARRAGFHAHVAAVISAAEDLAVIELPEGEPATDVYGEPITDYLHKGRTVMYIEPAGMREVGKPYTGPYNVQLMRGASGQQWPPDGAEQFAAALVATARAARAASSRAHSKETP